MNRTIEGGCACGSVRYRSSAKPSFAIHCYCRQCQRITGAGHASQFALPADAAAVTGPLSEYKLTADSGNPVTSAFCRTCGSPVLKRSAGYPQFVFFHAATLDDPSSFKPERAVWTGQRQAWDGLDASLPTDR